VPIILGIAPLSFDKGVSGMAVVFLETMVSWKTPFIWLPALSVKALKLPSVLI